MCGIAGKINFYHKDSIEEDLIKKMCLAIHHRGPDDAGFYVDQNVGLGHRRLSIIDLHSGHQPIYNEDRSKVIVFNGEIYNYQELRTELVVKGHSFSTTSDTEVILHLYEDFGEECLQKLNGMFSFAVWDNRMKILFLARDRIGIKPLYYYCDSQKLVFASEMKALFQDRSISFEIDLESIDAYLTYGYIPSPRSIYQNTYKLLPGHYIRVQEGKVNVKKYWDINYCYKEDRSKQETLAGLGDIFQQAVKSHMVSDVPVGAFLSGGIDSSAVVAMMSKLSNRPVKTFSIGFDEQDFDETSDARKIADYFKTDHHELKVKPNSIELINKLVRLYDEPFADSSAIPTFIVSELARQHVKVVLSGDGGDELFAGYTRYMDSERDQQFFKLPDFVRKNILGGVGDLLPPSFMGKNYFQYISKNRLERYLQKVSLFNKERKKILFHPDYKAQLNTYPSPAQAYLRQVEGADAVTQYLFLDSKMYLPEDILTKVDRASMANSLEVRVPLLDHRLIEYAATIPPRYKINAQNQKIIFKEALSSILPKFVFEKRKQGFGVPLKSWFRGELKSLVYDTLLSQRSINRGYFNRKSLKNLLDEHQTRDRDNSHLLWALLCLEIWHLEYCGK